MGIALFVHVVEAGHHLVEVGAGDVGRKPTTEGNEVEEFASSGVLEDDSEALVAESV